ncbi:recombination protein RecR [bacterium]|nr:recombination protein RecR [bacterium]
MDSLNRLAELFSTFPGIGPRQAGRFVQHLLRFPATRRELVELAASLSDSVQQCTDCKRFFSGETALCGICTNPKRDRTLLAVIATDADLLALERSNTFKGRYFVLGGTLSLASEKTSGIRLKDLLSLTKQNPEIEEVILAFPANPEGDATAVRVREEILTQNNELTVTTLGRGLSTGSELEYADAETLKNALNNRK